MEKSNHQWWNHINTLITKKVVNKDMKVHINTIEVSLVEKDSGLRWAQMWWNQEKGGLARGGRKGGHDRIRGWGL